MALVTRITLSGLLLAVMLLAALTIGTSAASAASPKASCLGHEASGVSPPGSSSEFPGGMPELLSFVKANIPGPPGATVSVVAKLHEGSHEACDEATE